MCGSLLCSLPTKIPWNSKQSEWPKRTHLLVSFTTAYTLLTSECFKAHLPPSKGLLREEAVLPGHQRVDGQVEALGEPRVAFQVSDALPTGARPLGEEAVRKAECVLEEVEGGVPESVAEQERREGDDTKQQSKCPEFSPFD